MQPCGKIPGERAREIQDHIIDIAASTSQNELCGLDREQQQRLQEHESPCPPHGRVQQRKHCPHRQKQQEIPDEVDACDRDDAAVFQRAQIAPHRCERYKTDPPRLQIIVPSTERIARASEKEQVQQQQNINEKE